MLKLVAVRFELGMEDCFDLESVSLLMEVGGKNEGFYAVTWTVLDLSQRSGPTLALFVQSKLDLSQRLGPTLALCVHSCFVCTV